jgi:hypothetical protein
MNAINIITAIKTKRLETSDANNGKQIVPTIIIKSDADFLFEFAVLLIFLKGHNAKLWGRRNAV